MNKKEVNYCQKCGKLHSPQTVEINGAKVNWVALWCQKCSTKAMLEIVKKDSKMPKKKMKHRTEED